MQDSALYLEADEDITSAIDKLGKTPGPSVHVVVPKRSTMLQSIINLKLLKKAAETHQKELVLVTADKIATDLAARVGLAVAPSLGAKAVVAEVEMPKNFDKNEEVIEDSTPLPPPVPPPSAPAPQPPKSKRPLLLKRRNLGEAPAVATVPSGEPSVAATRLPKVPNFNRLQKRAGWIGLAVVLIGGYWLFMELFSNAKVTLFANGNRTAVDTTFAVDTSGAGSSGSTLAGQTISLSKDLSGSFTPTGQQDQGTKATGTITVSNCFDANPHMFVAGTRFTAPDGKVFRSTADMTVPGGQGSFFGCTTPGTASVQVQADQNGDSYNEAGNQAYDIPGLPANQKSGQNSITAKGGQMSGGTSKTVTVVAQSDVDGEKAKLLAADTGNESRDLQGKVPNGYMLLGPSQSSSVSDVNSTPDVNAQGDTGNLTVKVTYTALAVKTTDYQAYIHAQEQKQVGSDNQIYDDGLGSAQLTSNGADNSNRQSFHFTAEAYSGQKIDTAAVAKQLASQRYGDASNTAAGLPGVTQAQIVNWPPWASNLPSRADKIKVVIQVAKQ